MSILDELEVTLRHRLATAEALLRETLEGYAAMTTEDFSRGADREQRQKIASFLGLNPDDYCLWVRTEPASTKRYLSRQTRETRARHAAPLAALALALLLPLAVHAQAPAAKTPRAKPISSITVKVYPAVKLDGKAWRITTSDLDSCVAWVSDRAAGAAEHDAFRACRKAIDLAVDTAHAAAEKAP